MVNYGGKELAAAHRTVRRNTIQIAREIPEEQYDFSPTAGTRTVRQLLAHIAMTTRMPEDFNRVKRITTLEGYDFPGFVGQLVTEEAKPRTRDEIIALLEQEGEHYASWLETLDDDFLDEVYTDPSGTISKTRFENLMSAKEHEMHHRGQLMLIQRMLGLIPHLTRERQARAAARPAPVAS